MQYRIDNINAFIDRITPIHKEITPKDWQEYEEFKKIMMKFSSLPGVQQDIPGITNILNARWAVVQSGQPENTSLEMLRNEIFSSLFPVDDAKIQPIKEALIQHVRNAGAVVDWTPESAPAHDQRTAAQHLITAVEEYNGSNWKGLLETLHLEIVNMNWAMSDEMQMEYSYSLTEL